MPLDDQITFYDILDISSDASPQDVREAYIRTKSTYHRDSIALYSLISLEEREEILKKIEEAYLVLSDPEKRRQYDQFHGHLSDSDNPFVGKDLSAPPRNVISIDRVPPMETVPDNEGILIPPTTDITREQRATAAHSPTSYKRKERPARNAAAQESPTLTSVPVQLPHATHTLVPPLQPPRPPDSRVPLPRLDVGLLQAIDVETEWRGSFLRKIRDAYQISLEEMAGITKITKTYLIAIETENYEKLPASVYVRGFIVQMAKVLKLPGDKVASAYLSRYHRAILAKSR